MPSTFLTAPIFGRPGPGTEYTAAFRKVTRDGNYKRHPGGGIIDGTKSRDPGNALVYALRAGLLMGKITASGKYAPSAFGLTSGALTGTGTSITLSAAAAAELVRRVGSTGTFKLTGPPSAAGVVRTLTVTYSAVDLVTGVVTITALGVNEVQRIDFDAASTAGNIKLQVSKVNGDLVTTANAAWNATDATYLAAINSALDTATGVVGGIVATAISAVDTDLGFLLTYSGTGYAGATWPMAQVMTFPTSSTKANYTRSTTGVDGRFVTASLAQPTDGSETPLTFVPDGIGLPIDDLNPRDIDFPEIPTGAVVDAANLLPWPADASLRAWVKARLRDNGEFVFGDAF